MKRSEIKMEAAGKLAEIACSMVIGNDPLNTYHQIDGIHDLLSKMTEEDRDKLTIEMLSFDIYAVLYSFQLFNAPDQLLSRFYDRLWRVIASNHRTLELVKMNYPLSELLGSNDNLTEESIIEAFNNSYLKPRYNDYTQLLGGVRYLDDEPRFNYFGLHVAKQMFGEVPERNAIAEFLLARFTALAGIVRHALFATDEFIKGERLPLPEHPEVEAKSYEELDEENRFYKRLYQSVVAFFILLIIFMIIVNYFFDNWFGV